MMTEDTRPKCVKCGGMALTILGADWYCGKCVNKYLKKLKEARDKIMMTE